MRETIAGFGKAGKYEKNDGNKPSFSRVAPLEFLPKEWLLVVLIIATGMTSFGLGRLSKQGQGDIIFEQNEAMLATPAFTSSNEPATSQSQGKSQGQYQGQPQTSPQNSAIKNSSVYSSISSTQVQGQTGGYVASKNGSVYHLPWCSGAQRINPENLVHFATKEAAEAAGLRPAQNCPGL